MKTNLPVTSREYKLMLNFDRFKDRATGAGEFLDLLTFLIEKEGGKVLEKQTKEEHRRTSYLDTPQFALRQNRFSLRLREEADRFQINLKYRDSDRYASAAQDVSASEAGKVKFEEDILPPFISKFSHSNSIDRSTLPDLNTMKEVTSLFPGLTTLNVDGNTPVETANDFQAFEVVRKLCKFQFEETEIIKASLSFWYLFQDAVWPLVGEFSFDYDAKTDDQNRPEEYSLSVVNGARRVFAAVQNQAGWLDLSGTTKTAFALEVL